MRNIPIIQSQLFPPPVSHRFVQRRQLNKKLLQIPNYPLTLLYAGAGYGKSTTLTLFANSNKNKVCWYSISQNDDDLFPFIAKLIESIRLHHANFGKSIQKELLRQYNYLGPEEVYALATLFINEVLELKQNVLLILDDFHHVMHVREIEKWMMHLMEYIPANLHVIVASRRKPRWDMLPKLRGQGQLLELTQYDLVLQPSEMAYILEEVYGRVVSKEDVAKIYRLTEGWAIAFNMFAQQMTDKTSIPSLLQNQKKSLKDLFAYLATEVLSKQSFITQQFLMQSSSLQELSPETCNHVLEIQGSKELLAGLVEQNLFIEEGEGGVYRYHALFQTFLENIFKQRYEKEWQDVNKRAASYYKQQGAIETALFHYQKMGESAAVASLLHEHGLNMLQSGRLQALYDLLESLAPPFKNEYPVLYFYQGEMERYRSLYEQAEKSYDAMIAEISETDARHDYMMSLALEGKARIYLDTIQPDRAERFVNQAIYYREKTNTPAEEMAALYLLMSENLLNAGKAEKAENWYDRANHLKLPVENSNLQARIYLRTGRLQKAKDLLEKKDPKEGVENEKHLAQAHRETNLLLSFIHALMGEAEKSKELASSGIQLGLAIQSPFVEACGWMRMGHAVHLLGYDRALAIECYETALEIMEKINVSRGKAEPYMGLSILYGKKQAYNLAVENAEKALKETDKVNDRWLSAFIRIGLAITEIYDKHFNRAKALLKQIWSELQACGDQYGLTVVAFWSAYIAYLEKDEEQFSDKMGLFLYKASTEGYDFFLERRTIFGLADMQNMIPLLLQARKQKIELEYTISMLKKLGLDEKVDNHPGYTLQVQTLGPLRVWLGTKQTEVEDWQRGKAKELFELFLTNRKQFLQKDEIFETLWPDLDEEAANKNFKVALNALNKAVEPGRKARQEAFFIKREGTRYQLNPDAGMEIDSVRFEKFIIEGLEERDARRSQELLEKGLKLYQGDYLEDLQYTNWTEVERKRLQQIFLRGAERFAQALVRNGEFDLCIDWCERILEIDNTWEEAYRLLMYCYYQNHNRPQAMKWYEQCCTILEEELGIEPMGPTQEMYEIIMEAEELELY